MKLTLSEGINGCTIITCTLGKDDNTPELSIQSLMPLPLNQQITVIIPADKRFNTTSFCDALKRYRPDKIIVAGMEEMDLLSENFQYQHYTSPQAFYGSAQKSEFFHENILVFETDKYRFKNAFLDSKIRHTKLEVNFDALAENIRYFQSKLKPNVQLMALVKAFSYGSGSYEVACLMQLLGVDYLGVAASDEGISLRRSGITLPIVVLTPELDNVAETISYNLEPEIHNIRSLNTFVEAVNQVGLVGYPIHVKIDSGMHRQGFEMNDIDELASIIRKNESIEVASAFTHLAATDEEKHDDFTRQQLNTFAEVSQALEDKLGCKFIRHALNSAGIERFPEGQFDMVRLGIGMYGGSTVSQAQTRVVSTLRSVVTQIKDITPNDTVGYGRIGEVKKHTRIAVVPIGYADGLNRRLSNGVGKFMINGQPAPIIGNICMDLTMTDITGLDVKEGDEVIIFGDEPTIFELADKLGTITYEILTSVAARVKRVYTFTEKLFSL
ncbi:MAG: alanine racemase [Prevotellaceae bacterium]|jgi:alanine racemase|nr:alanine racemase [Prevotellaceae bacterium]